jgi:hypothetical protein
MESVKSQDNTLLYVVIGVVLFFFVLLPNLNCSNKEKLENISSEQVKSEQIRSEQIRSEQVQTTGYQTPSNYSNIEPTNNNIVKIDENKCSKECCKHTQWPVPHDVTPKAGSEFIGNNMSCNWGEGSGCVCLKKDDFKFLSVRGTNSNIKEDVSMPTCKQ